MHRSIIAAVALALGLVARDPHGPPACGHRPVVAGESNRFFTAASARSIAISADVRATMIKDAHDRGGVRMIARDGSVATVTCECPASCAAAVHRTFSFGCWALTDSEEPSQCWEECGGSDASCASCRLVVHDGDSSGTDEPAQANRPTGTAIAESKGQ